MKNRMFAAVIISATLFFLISLSLFAQDQPEKKDNKASNQFTTTHVQNSGKTDTKQQAQDQNQKEMKKTDNKVTTDDKNIKASTSKDNKNNESVNTQYHKKQETTSNGQQTQIKNPTKGGKIE